MAKLPKVPPLTNARPQQLPLVTLQLAGVEMNVLEGNDGAFVLAIGPFALKLLYPLTAGDAQRMRTALEPGSPPQARAEIWTPGPADIVPGADRL